jgi:hypothetical protein
MPNQQPLRVAARAERVPLWTPARFLFVGGAVLISIGMAGATGILGTVSRANLFHPPYWINWFHLSFGIVVLRIVIAGDRKLQKQFTLVAFVMGTTLGLSGMLLGSYVALRYDMPQLADSSDPIAHLAVGMLALAALWNRKGSADRRRSPL